MFREMTLEGRLSAMSHTLAVPSTHAVTIHPGTCNERNQGRLEEMQDARPRDTLSLSLAAAHLEAQRQAGDGLLVGAEGEDPAARVARVAAVNKAVARAKVGPDGNVEVRGAKRGVRWKRRTCSPTYPAKKRAGSAGFHFKASTPASNFQRATACRRSR